VDPVALSKLMSFVLRHAPDEFGLRLEREGWVSLNQFCRALEAKGHPVSREQVLEAVRTNDKRRFALSEDGTRIRASQGHSTVVDLGYTASPPPARLFHGTVTRFVASIRATGLIRGNRLHVHLSASASEAERVGARRGSPVVLAIDAGEMHGAGHQFFLSENGVWLTVHVPPVFILFPESSSERDPPR